MLKKSLQKHPCDVTPPEFELILLIFADFWPENNDWEINFELFLYCIFSIEAYLFRPWYPTNLHAVILPHGCISWITYRYSQGFYRTCTDRIEVPEENEMRMRQNFRKL